MTAPDAALSAAKREVEHLFGKCLLRLQAIELLLKAIVAAHHLSGLTAVPDAEDRKITETQRKTLGILVADMLGSVLVPAGMEGLPDADEAANSGSGFALLTQIVFPAKDFARIEVEHRDLVTLRNTLVHHFLEEHDLRTENGCRVARQALTVALDRIARANGDLTNWARQMEQVRKAMANHLALPEMRNWIATGRLP